uniref:Uncharacterized protein n=1 Tax=Hanusia phi TaxID=3032 RepID=A0A7S0EHW1_9CRYP
MVGYGSVEAKVEEEMRMRRKLPSLPLLSVFVLAAVAILAVVLLHSSTQGRIEEVEFPKDNLGVINVLRSSQPAASQPMTQMMRESPKKHESKLSLPQQYARIMQNMGYFAPWSRVNSWEDRVAINNIRKANTPQALAMRQKQIERENAKFARKFSTPHTSQYTGVHESLEEILDPRFTPWSNDSPRKAYYQGY